jgi:hypothetical protein
MQNNNIKNIYISRIETETENNCYSVGLTIIKYFTKNENAFGETVLFKTKDELCNYLKNDKET